MRASKQRDSFFIFIGAVATFSTGSWAAGMSGRDLDEVVVTASRIGNLVGLAVSASEGTVSAAQIENRPVLRTGEVLEVVSVLVVTSIGVTYNHAAGWFGGARLRYLGPAPLIEDNTVRSESTTLVNFNLGYHLTSAITASVTLLNAFDEQANDITYYYESQLQGETEPVNDIHFHPVEPREVRVTLAARF